MASSLMLRLPSPPPSFAPLDEGRLARAWAHAHRMGTPPSLEGLVRGCHGYSSPAWRTPIYAHLAGPKRLEPELENEQVATGRGDMRRAWSQAAATAVAVLFFRTPGRASPAANPPAMPSLAPRGSGSDRTVVHGHAGASRHLPPPPTLLGHVRFPVLQPHPRAFP